MSITIVSAIYGNVSVAGAFYYLREGGTIRAVEDDAGCTFTASPGGQHEFVGRYGNKRACRRCRRRGANALRIE